MLLSFWADGFYTERRSWRIAFNSLVPSFPEVSGRVQSPVGESSPKGLLTIGQEARETLRETGVLEPRTDPDLAATQAGLLGMSARKADQDRLQQRKMQILQSASEISFSQLLSRTLYRTVAETNDRLIESFKKENKREISLANLNQEESEVFLTGNGVVSEAQLRNSFSQGQLGQRQVGSVESELTKLLSQLSEQKRLSFDGDPLETAQTQVFSEGLREQLRRVFAAFLLTSVRPELDQRLQQSVVNPNDPSVQQRLRELADGALDGSTSDISSRVLDRLLGLLQLQQQINPNNEEQVARFRLVALGAQKRVDEQEVGVILASLQERGEQALSPIEQRAVIEQLRQLALSNSPSGVKDPLLARLKNTKEDASSQQFAKELIADLQEIVKQLARPLSLEQNVEQAAQESEKIKSTEEEEGRQGDSAKQRGPEDARAFIGRLTLPILGIRAPQQTSHGRMPGESEQQKESKVSKHIGPLTHPMVNLGITDAYLISLAAEEYQHLRVRDIERKNQEVPSYGARYEQDRTGTNLGIENEQRKDVQRQVQFMRDLEETSKPGEEGLPLDLDQLKEQLPKAESENRPPPRTDLHRDGPVDF